MDANRILGFFFLIFTVNGHSSEWSEGKLLPEKQAVVRTVAQLMEHSVRSSSHPFAQPSRLFPNFTAATYEDSGVVPPDAMGAAGPTQYILAANGRIRSFDKKTGLPDDALDISTSGFFSSISEGFTSDSRIRYDRFSDRWYIVILGAAMHPIRFLLAMSEKGIIIPETTWSFFYFEPHTSDWSDYPTLGIDKHALYIGYNYLKSNGGYITSEGIVIPKEPLIKGTLNAYAFQNLVDPDPSKLEGPISPQGVDNFDEDAIEGYFVGIDGRPGRLMMRRVKDPGGHPMISENIAIKVPSSQFPLPVPQKGSFALNEFFLQGFDKRLGNTHIRNKLLYTAHNVGVDNTGSSETSTPTRDGCLWYEIDLKDSEHPSILQSGMLFQPSRTNDREERYYWMPGLMTNGLHTLVIACSTSGDKVFADAAYALRYSNDPLGTLRKPHRYTHSDALYTLGFPPFKNLRFGEYSTASVDPSDDMTLWSIAEFSRTALSWGLQAIRIPAKPPAKIIKVIPATIKPNQTEVAITILGERVNGSAFYDPGERCPNRLQVDIEGVKVLSVKWVSPVEVGVVVSTEGTSVGPKKITIRNPDGQKVESLLDVRL